TPVVAGNISRGSSALRAAPPSENGWHGGPPVTRSVLSAPGTVLQSMERTSPSITLRFCTNGKPLAAFSRMLWHAHLFHSAAAMWLTPASDDPSSSPPPPANSSTPLMVKVRSSTRLEPLCAQSTVDPVWCAPG